MRMCVRPTCVRHDVCVRLLFAQPEFDEWVAMDDVSSLPEKCRVRPVLELGDNAIEETP